MKHIILFNPIVAMESRGIPPLSNQIPLCPSTPTIPIPPLLKSALLAMEYGRLGYSYDILTISSRIGPLK